MQTDPYSYIGVVSIDPDRISAVDHSYVVECPKHSIPICVGWASSGIVLWVQAPANEVSYGSKMRLWIVPGGRRLTLAVGAGVFIGTVLVPKGDETAEGYADWHFFHDRSGADVTEPAQSHYALH